MIRRDWKRTPISAREKCEICLYAAEHPHLSQQSIALQLGQQWGKNISRRAVCNILAERDKWMQCTHLHPGVMRFRTKCGRHETLESNLQTWVMNQDRPVTEEELREQARNIGHRLGIADFNYSNGWIQGFKKRRGIFAVHSEAPKDNVGPGENSWAAQTSQAAMPSTSRSKEMSPRPSTSATHTGGFLIKQDPGTPPPVQQQVMNPYIQEPPMVQSAPRLLPKPTAPPPQPQVMQQQPRLRIRQPQHHVPPQPAPPDPEPQQVCLRWNSFHNNMQTMFPTLLNKEKFVDVTLACEGQTVKCHKVVLSSCSAYIERLLTENPCKHPIILMPNTMRYWQIRALVDFMYRGEVNVEHEQLSSLLAAAEFLQVKGLAGPPTSPEQNTNIEDPEPEPPLSPRPKRKRVASPSPVPQHRQPVAAPPTPQPQQQQRTSLPNSPAVSITRLKQTPSAAQATPSTSRDTGSRAQSPGIEITPVVSFEEIKMEPIDISDSNDESMDPNMHCDVDYDMDNGDGDADKDYDDEDLDDDSGDVGRGEDDTGGREGDPGPSLQPSSDDQPGTSKTTSNGPDLTTPGFSGNGIEIDDSAASYCAADLGLTTEPPEDPPDSGPGPSGL